MKIKDLPSALIHDRYIKLCACKCDYNCSRENYLCQIYSILELLENITQTITLHQDIFNNVI